MSAAALKRGLYLAGAAAPLFWASVAGAQDSGGLTGDWDGARARLEERGVELTVEYTSESATNLSGGEHRRARETGQLTLGATFDTGRLIGLEGGTFQATVTYRRGEDLGAAAGLGVLQQVQEVYGRGQTWRLTQFWYEHIFVGDGDDRGGRPGSDNSGSNNKGSGNGGNQRQLALKVGRMTVGEDFAAFSCEFQNLSFCGAPPGNIVGDYWYNWPVSQWGARLKLKSSNGYIQAAAYEVNPANLDNEFTLGHLSGSTGILVPLELAWTPHLGEHRLPGSYKFGGWYDTSNADDVFLDAGHRPRVLTGREPLQHSGRYGAYVNFQQQITGAADNGAATSGLTLFFNATQADRHTATLDSQIAAGIFLTGPLSGRPDDRIGIAIGRTHINDRAARAQRMGRGTAAVQEAEYATELFYRFQAASWLTLSPNLQFIHNPGGIDDETDVVVLGLKATVAL